MNCGSFDCPECKDRLIHQNNRGPDESASGLGQYVHDNFRSEFYFADTDWNLVRVRHHLWRYLEISKPGRPLSRAHQSILPLVANGIAHLVSCGILHRDSGVFIVHTAEPFDQGNVRQVGGKYLASLKGREFDGFLCGLTLEEIELGVEPPRREPPAVAAVAPPVEEGEPGDWPDEDWEGYWADCERYGWDPYEEEP